MWRVGGGGQEKVLGLRVEGGVETEKVDQVKVGEDSLVARPTPSKARHIFRQGNRLPTFKEILLANSFLPLSGLSIHLAGGEGIGPFMYEHNTPRTHALQEKTMGGTNQSNARSTTRVAWNRRKEMQGATARGFCS